MDLSEYRTYESAREAAHLIVEGLGSINRLKADTRKSTVDPSFHQLLRGLCLERARDGTLRLWTPWGAWDFCRTSLECDEPLPDIGQLKLLAYDTGACRASRHAAPNVSAVHQAGNLILPYPREKTPEQLISTIDADRRWKILTQRYTEQHNPE